MGKFSVMFFHLEKIFYQYFLCFLTLYRSCLADREKNQINLNVNIEFLRQCLLSIYFSAIELANILLWTYLLENCCFRVNQRQWAVFSFFTFCSPIWNLARFSSFISLQLHLPQFDTFVCTFVIDMNWIS